MLIFILNKIYGYIRNLIRLIKQLFCLYLMKPLHLSLINLIDYKIYYQFIKSDNDFTWYFQTEFLIKIYFSSGEVVKNVFNNWILFLQSKPYSVISFYMIK